MRTLRLLKIRNLAIYILPLVRVGIRILTQICLMSFHVNCFQDNDHFGLLKLSFLGKFLLRRYLLDNECHNHNDLYCIQNIVYVMTTQQHKSYRVYGLSKRRKRFFQRWYTDNHAMDSNVMVFLFKMQSFWWPM